MDNKTVQYKRTLRGSVGAGMSAIFNGSGRRYYILEHKDASKYHKAGESQKIIIDQVELGRDANCQVRFDESFPTVSRRHAAIVKDGERWKLVQLSKTNSTFLNGRSIDTEWYLENGDEIQLSVGGPKLGFIVPAGKQSLVSSIKMTERLDLFRKQALRPYKAAIAALFVILIVLSCGAGYVIHNQELDIKDLMAKAENQAALFAEARKKWTADSTALAKDIQRAKKSKKTVIVRPKGEDLTKELDRVRSSVYAVTTIVHVEISGQSEKYESHGTGFLLDDGRFVTARHCVEPWMYTAKNDIMQVYYALQEMMGGAKIYAEIVARNKNGDVIKMSSSDFRIDKSYDTPTTFVHEVFGDLPLHGAIAYGTEASLGNDWAYCRVSKHGSIADGRAFSDKLKSGTTVHILGFPKDHGRENYDPIYYSMTVSRDGLNDARCIMVSQGADHGNSGGPVFALQNGKLQAVGIVSRGDYKSDYYNHLIPMSNLR